MKKTYDMHYHRPPRYIVEVTEPNVTSIRAHEVAEENNAHSYRLTPTSDQEPGERFYILKGPDERKKGSFLHKGTYFAKWSHETYHYATIFPPRGSDLFKEVYGS
jgi:hypothetical protein